MGNKGLIEETIDIITMVVFFHSHVIGLVMISSSASLGMLIDCSLEVHWAQFQ